MAKKQPKNKRATAPGAIKPNARKKAPPKPSKKPPASSELARFDTTLTKQLKKLLDSLVRDMKQAGHKVNRMTLMEDLLWSSPKITKLAKAKNITRVQRPSPGRPWYKQAERAEPVAAPKKAATKKAASKRKATKKKATKK